MNIPECISVNLGIPLAQVLAHIYEESDNFEAQFPSHTNISDLNKMQEIAKRNYETTSQGTPEKYASHHDWVIYSMQAMQVARREYEIIATVKLSPQNSISIAWAIRKLKLIYIQKMAEVNILAAQER